MIVVTGSAGYIGGQTVIELKKAGHSVIGIDIRDHSAYITEQLDVVIKEDFISELALGVIVNEKPDAIIHCAGSSLVGPSNVDPSTYYENNFVKTKILADVLLHNGLHDTRLVFSSSASVYGEPALSGGRSCFANKPIWRDQTNGRNATEQLPKCIWVTKRNTQIL